MITIVSFDFATKTEREVQPSELVSERAAGRFCWVDLDCHPCRTSGATCGGCHACLDALKMRPEVQREVLGPECEGRYDVHADCLHFAVTEARFEDGRLVTAHVDVVLGDGYLVTSRQKSASFMAQMRRVYRDDFHAFAQSPGFLLYEIADRLLESYRRALHQVAEAVERVQLQLFGEVDDAIFRQVAVLTQDILSFRKVVMASRELLHELASRRSPFISVTTQPFLETMAGTLERLGADLTTEREVLNETLNLYMGMVSHRTNKVVNRLTVISMIFLPLSFIVGVYGMNLQGMPEMAWSWGYVYFWVLCIGVAATLLILMKRRKWL